MPRIPWIEPDDHDSPFPDVSLALAEPNGLLAIGGPLSPGRLKLAYRSGIFPWFSDDQPVLWWSPDPRAVLYPARLRISRSLRKRLRHGGFAVTFDHAFDAVIHACAQPRPDQAGTWITPHMIAAYVALHEQGVAHSVECWRDGELVGGLYGVSLGGAFFGESMFSLASDASKVSLSWLAAQLQGWGFHLIDCQLPTAHLASLGAVEISRERFISELQAALTLPDRLGRWSVDPENDPAYPRPSTARGEGQ